MDNKEPVAPADIARTVEALQRAVEPFFAAIARQVAATFEALRPLVEYYQEHPEAFAAEPTVESCHCLCQVTHDGGGICQGEAEEGLKVTRHSVSVGTVHIPMCRPCHDAAPAHAG